MFSFVCLCMLMSVSMWKAMEKYNFNRDNRMRIENSLIESMWWMCSYYWRLAPFPQVQKEVKQMMAAAAAATAAVATESFGNWSMILVGCCRPLKWTDKPKWKSKQQPINSDFTNNFFSVFSCSLLFAAPFEFRLDSVRFLVLSVSYFTKLKQKLFFHIHSKWSSKMLDTWAALICS